MGNDKEIKKRWKGVEKGFRKGWERTWAERLGQTADEATKRINEFMKIYVNALVDEGLIEFQKPVSGKDGTESIKTIFNKIKCGERGTNDSTR